MILSDVPKVKYGGIECEPCPVCSKNPVEGVISDGTGRYRDEKVYLYCRHRKTVWHKRQRLESDKFRRHNSKWQDAAIDWNVKVYGYMEKNKQRSSQ